MAILKEICRSCGAELEAAVGQAVVRHRLYWHRSFSCQHCGAQIEEDGYGIPPHDVRFAILRDEGEWTLVLDDLAERTTLALKLIRQALGLSLVETAAVRKHIPGAVLDGTQAEMQWLAMILSNAGIRSFVQKVTRESSSPHVST
jgi:hypothetical protein